MHYAQNPAAAPKPPEGGHVPDGSVPPYPPMNAHAVNATINHAVNQQYLHEQGSPNDFRARFHRPLVAPSPFRMGAEQQQQAIAAVAAAAAAGAAAAAAAGEQPLDPGSNLDPQLGQARDEAVGVAKQLERS
jgi:hypothetical protein